MHRSSLPILLSGLLLVVPGWLRAAEIPPDKAVITLQPKFGPVRFSHQRHATAMGIACQDCHHTLQVAAQPRRCHDCHQAKVFRVAATRPADAQPEAAQLAPVRAKLAFHGLCQGCHVRLQGQQLASGPTDSCRDCHD